MDFDLPEELKMLRETVRRFVEKEVIPLEREFRPEGEEMPERFLRPLQEKARALGLWLLEVPEEYGGAGLGLLARCVIAEELSRSVAVPYRGNEIFGPEVRPLLFYCNEEQKERFLFPVLRGEKRVCFAQTEPDAGSDPASMRTRATQRGDYFALDGRKRFISGAGRSDFAQVMAVTDPQKGARGGITCFMVDMKSPGVLLERQWPTMMGDAPWEIVFQDVHVPAANVVGNLGEGFSLGQKWITEGRIQGHGARPLGMAQRSLDMMIDYAHNRVTFGRPLAERQAIQFMVADSAMELHLARLMLYECAWRHDRGEDVRDLSYMVKIVSVETASRVVDRSIQVHGGIGLTKELPLEWWYRQLRSLRITEGATEVLRWRLARNLMTARKPQV
ncbi:MAG: acyl-CoA dehydrogenase family protein [Deltaproteobacteria bacterium]|nr:acyl-CoA dehydrogenase family protein [Deltaproteobacteria bacterium]